ncbi:YfhO family protein [Bacteroidales bacterium OttesenSCG-928-I21]|nr:YfhO family protein [Bacteroidales bacterium OttesenSCG-928-I21]
MKDNFFKRNIPHFVAIAVFLVLSAIYCTPLFQGKKLITHDYSVYTAVSKSINDYEKESGEIPLWTNSMFSGMPSYLVSTPKSENLFNKIYNFFRFGLFTPFYMIFWYLLGFYICLILFRVNPWFSLLGALAFAFSSYFFIIISAGHVTKSIAIGYMAPMIGAVYYAFEQKRAWIGMLIFGFFMTLQVIANHVQITYYTGIVIIIYGVFELINAIKEKYISRFFKTVGILSIGVVFALGINAAALLTTAEYTPYSIRGKSELSSAAHDRTSGLDKSYATAWSYGIGETFTLLIPNVKGGASQSPLSESSASYSVIENYFGKRAAKDIVKNMPTYFGDQPFTSGPVYVGAFIMFLFVLSLFVVKGRVKWWLLTATILSVLLSWGHNFEKLTNFFLDYVPAYNKFRTVSMILVIAELTIPLMAILGLVEIFKEKIEKKKLITYFYIALGTTGIICMLFIVVPRVAGSSGKGKSEIEFANVLASYFPSEQQYEQTKDVFKDEMVSAIYKDRPLMVRSDAFRSLVFIILGAAVVYLVIQKKLKTKYALVSMMLIVLIDMWTVDRRYLNNDNYASKKKFEVPYEKSKADEFILKDKTPHYRVYNGAVSTFNDGSTSYYHNSIGGYSGAKMRRYQELNDSIMGREMQMALYLIGSGYKSGFEAEQIQSLFNSQAKLPILNMLNAKYIIYDPNRNPIINNNALGNAWFIDEFVWVDNPDEEITKLKDIEPSTQAVISKQFQEQLAGFKFSGNKTGTIELKEITPNSVSYKTSTTEEQIAVFSEIYYPKGWKVSIDNNEAEHFRVNYVLRSMRIPAGEHTVKFSFEPQSYSIGVIISYICSICLLLLIAISVFFEIKKGKTKYLEKKI